PERRVRFAITFGSSAKAQVKIPELLNSCRTASASSVVRSYIAAALFGSQPRAVAHSYASVAPACDLAETNRRRQLFGSRGNHLMLKLSTKASSIPSTTNRIRLFLSTAVSSNIRH